MAENFFTGFSDAFNAARKTKLANRVAQQDLEFRQQKEANDQANAIARQQFQERQAAALEAYRANTIKIQQQQADIQKQTADLAATEKMMQFMDPKYPLGMRKAMINQYARSQGIDTKSPDFKDMQNALTSLDAEQAGQWKDALTSMIPDMKNQPGRMATTIHGLMSGKLQIADVVKEFQNEQANKDYQNAMGAGGTGVAGVGGPPTTDFASTNPQSRLLSSTPMALQPATQPPAPAAQPQAVGGNLPVPGLPSTGAPAAPMASAGGGVNNPAPQDQGETSTVSPQSQKAQFLYKSAQANMAVAMKSNDPEIKRTRIQMAQQMVDQAKALEASATSDIKVGEGEQPIYDKSGKVVGVQPIVGSKRYDEVQAAKKQEEAAKASITRTASDIERNLGQARTLLGDPEKYTSGLVAAAKGIFPDSDVAQMKLHLDSVKSNLAIETIQKMRSENKSGGALGNVSNQDIELLKNLIENLSYTQQGPALYNAIRTIQNRYMDLIQGKPEELKKALEEGKIDQKTYNESVKRWQTSSDEKGQPVANFQYDHMIDPNEQKNQVAEPQPYSPGEKMPPPKITGGQEEPQQNWPDIIVNGQKYKGPRNPKNGMILGDGWKSRDNWEPVNGQ